MKLVTVNDGTTISEESYRADLAYSASDLKKLIAENPFSLWNQKHNPEGPLIKFPESSVFRIGRAVHAAVLEPNEYHSRYGFVPDRRTKEGKAEAARLQAEGKTVLNPTEWQLVQEISGAVARHPLAGPLFNKGKAEQSIWWDHQTSGLTCKCRCDWINDSNQIIDLKTTGEGGASPKAFANSIGKFSYHLQAAHYMQGVMATDFVFVVVEKAWPYNIGVYRLDQEALDEGLELQQVALHTIADCIEKETWPDYNNGKVQTLELPGYYQYRSVGAQP